MIDLKDDRPPYVTFELRPEEDRAKTIENGYFTTQDVEYALITPPYSKDRIEKTVKAWFDECEVNVREGRMPQKWFDYWKTGYKAWKEGQEIPVDGQPIKGWRKISPAQEKNLLAIGVRTVEDLAKMNDEGMKRYGMGAQQLKDLAIAELKDPNKLANENAALKADLATANERIDALVKRLEAVEAKAKKEKAAA